MFDFDIGKLLLIGVVALIFIPPKDLPAALRQLGKLVGQARRIASDFQSQFSEAIRDSEFGSLKEEFSQLKTSASLEGAMTQLAEIVEPVAAGAAPVAAEAAPVAVEEAAVASDGPVGPEVPAIPKIPGAQEAPTSTQDAPTFSQPDAQRAATEKAP